MCIAIPYKILNVKKDGRAEVEIDGRRQEVSCLMVPDIKEGDYVLIYLCSIVSKMEAEEAAEVMRLFEDINSLSEETLKIGGKQ